ncbi:nucleotidyltransferase-like protein [Salisediminibacterium selenitireducens]|uniref:Nucleotidyltransferase-like domain-containing protein n=1 Tax=Bacillus selenitireducens (strain ATCC 700615 / DSM 15326 / MLS10) TaxID=439292 RepID=D6XYE2_BACIE|nr:nucleotidyltransferase-like protein [Salisediminibacterium selenitireducens]ADI00211.1 hypothetical protein Bsel_2714 [[Bacillus] selenitireducens MLS10]
MESFLRELYQDQTSDGNTLGIIKVDKRERKDANTDYFDHVLFVILKDREQGWEVKHYESEGIKAAMHLVTERQLNDWLLNMSNRRVVDWLFNGRIVFDRNGYVKSFREKMNHFPEEERLLKIGVEFSKLIRRYTDGKTLFYSGDYLDAYNHIIHALHHLARLSVIEHGFYPEVTVWQQVKEIEPEIHKLYSELTNGSEAIEKRLELLLIANEFEVSRKTELGSRHLLQLMEKRDEPWSIQELKGEVGIREYSLDLGIMIEFLVDKGVIDIQKVETKGKQVYHRRYMYRGKS